MLSVTWFGGSVCWGWRKQAGGLFTELPGEQKEPLATMGGRGAPMSDRRKDEQDFSLCIRLVRREGGEGELTVKSLPLLPVRDPEPGVTGRLLSGCVSGWLSCLLNYL